MGCAKCHKFRIAHLKRVRQNTLSLQARIRNSAISEEILMALRILARAIDQPDLHNAYTGLWSVLEYLTCSEHKGYGPTVERAAKLFNQHEIVRQILEHHRTRRNQIIHRHRQFDKIEADAYNLYSIVQSVLQQVIKLSGKFLSRNELELFFEKPYSVDDLRTEKRLAISTPHSRSDDQRFEQICPPLQSFPPFRLIGIAIKVNRRSLPRWRYMTNQDFLPDWVMRRPKPLTSVSKYSSRPLSGRLAFLMNCAESFLVAI